MKKKKLKTIELKGNKYVQVHERISYFNEEFTNGKIVTIPTFVEEDSVYFRATATPDVDVPQRHFTGHSYGKIGDEKALEKLETVAVGRCLAQMGIGILEGGIASAEEIQLFHESIDNQLELAKKGELRCMDCSSTPTINQSGTGFYCPNKYKDKSKPHDKFVSLAEIEAAKPEGSPIK